MGAPDAVNGTATARPEREQWDIEISPDRTWWRLDLKELWHHRDLMLLLVRRDITAQYKQTLLGPLWHVVQPLLTTLTYTLMFGMLARLAPGNMPPLLFYMSGIIIWNYFAAVITRTSRTFVGNAQLMSKVYFPRLVVPVSTTVSSLVSFAIQFAAFLVIYGWFFLTAQDRTWGPTAALVLLPVLVLLMSVLSLGIGILVSALTTKYRDISFLVGFGIQLLMFASPVIFPMSLVAKHPAMLQVLRLNPMTPVIEGVRVMFFGGALDWSGLGYTAAFATVVTAVALVVFHKVEQYFADIV